MVGDCMDGHLQENGKDAPCCLALAPTPESTAEVLAFVETCLGEMPLSAAATAKLLIATDEIYSNTVKYSDASKASVEYAFSGGVVTLFFRDDGVPFDPLQVDYPDVSLSAEERPVGGLGVFMVREMMDEVSYERQGCENVFTIRMAV